MFQAWFRVQPPALLRSRQPGFHSLTIRYSLRRRATQHTRYLFFEMASVKAQYHPFQFALIALCAMAELGLTVFLIYAGNANGTWPSPLYHSLLIFLCFNSAWTVIFSTAYIVWMVDGAVHLLASIASSVIWMLVTALLWGSAAALMFYTRRGGNCDKSPPISRCRQSLTVESLAWAELGLCLITMLVTCLWLHKSNINYRSSYYEV